MQNLVNHVQLMGNLGQSPQLRTFDSGSKMCQISLATNERYKDKSGEYQDKTTWHRIVAWGPKAERLAQLQKGDRLALQGKLSNRSYDDAEGNTRYITEVILQEFMQIGTEKEKLVS